MDSALVVIWFIEHGCYKEKIQNISSFHSSRIILLNSFKDPQGTLMNEFSINTQVSDNSNQTSASRHESTAMAFSTKGVNL